MSVSVCSRCGHGSNIHGPEAGGCIECPCPVIRFGRGYAQHPVPGTGEGLGDEQEARGHSETGGGLGGAERRCACGIDLSERHEVWGRWT